MITREQLSTGIYLNAFQNLPGEPWSAERIASSMHRALAQRPAGSPVWLFGYGSLIWNPLLKFVERQNAVLQGWHRSFSIRLEAGRATPDCPGRMLALEPGGHSQGVAFRLAEQDLHEELGLVWIREMPHGLYRPLWERIRLSSGVSVQSLTFVAEPSHPQHEQDASVKTAAPLIAQAQGHLGTNREYLRQLDLALAQEGFLDPYVHDLADAVRALSTRSSPL